MAKTKTCKCGCKQKAAPEDGVIVNMAWFVSFDHAAKHGIKLSTALKKRQLVKKKKDNRTAARVVKDNDRRHQFKLTKEVIQKWVNHVRDSEFGCISCGTTKPTILYSGGHYRTAGGNPEIALESKNIHKQCLFNCNKNKSGNISGDKHSIGFKKGLIERYGEDYVDWLESHHESNRLDCDQLRELRAYYNRLIREKKKTDEDRPFF